jgi:hypothetical protein
VIDYTPDLARVRELAADCLRRWMRSLGPIDIGCYAEEDDWPEIWGAEQLPQRHQGLFMAAVEQAVRTAVGVFAWPAEQPLEPGDLDVAIERVVKASGDPGGLFVAVSVLADFMGYRLVAKPPVVHRYFGGHWDGDVYIAACGQPDRNHQDRKGHEINCPGCVKTWNDAEFAEPDPKPKRGDHGTCVCGGAITYWDSPHGGWWAHDERPADGHDAELGGPA